ncbi:MAG: Rv3235 family protein [Bifidobacteriaceae bacterium]|nr:Rv3235 family protein [Bifidobacteriaceae bacterium]
MADHSFWHGFVPGPVRLPALESRVRFVASTALTADHGHPPSSSLEQYVTPAVFRSLVARSKVRSACDRLPAYCARTYLCQVNRRVIEATVVASDGAGARAVAMRLERQRGGWRACEVVLV